MSNQDYYVFFLRHYNDIDHISPIIYNLAKEKQSLQIEVCLIENYHKKNINGYSFTDDYRIELIQQLSNCEVYFLNDLILDKEENMKKNAKKETTYFIKRWGRKLPTQLPKRIWDSVVTITPNREKNWEEIAKKVYEELLINKSDSVVAFDWITSTGDRGDFVNYVVERANLDGHATVSLPHGDAPFTNYWTKLDNNLIKHENFEYSSEGIRSLIYNKVEIDYDYIVVPNNTVKNRRSHQDGDRLCVLGSPRFNEQWVNKLTEIAPKFESEINESSHRVVLFTRKPSYTVDQKALAEAIQIIAQFSNLSVIVKHHTRSSRNTLYNRLTSQFGQDIANIKNIQMVSDDVHSVSLLEWGDIFVDAGTSIIFEAIVRNKPVLALEYAHWNKSTIAHYLSDQATLRSRDDLYEYMSTINQLNELGNKAVTYSPKERNLFMEEMIHLGCQNVLSKYTKFLTNL